MRHTIQTLFGMAVLSAGAVFGSGVQASDGAAAVKITAKLAQGVVAKDNPGKIYLRVGLEGGAVVRVGERPALNVAVVVDRSGSMQGAKIEQAKAAAAMALGRLGGRDTAALVTYNHEVQVMMPAMGMGDAAPVRQLVSQIMADGTTALYAGTEAGIKEVAKGLERKAVNRVVLLSDGLANVGPSSPTEVAALGIAAAKQGITISTIGLGLGFNEDLMTKLAGASDGNHAFVENADQLVAIFDKEFGDALSIVAREVQVEVDLAPGFKLARVLGREAKVEGRRITAQLGQLASAQEKYLMLEIEATEPLPLGKSEVGTVRAAYTDAATGERLRWSQPVGVEASTAKDLIEASIDQDVKADVVIQVATATNEEAVKLRDAGKIEEAKKLLQENAEYLGEAKAALPAASAIAVGTLVGAIAANRAAARGLADGDWERTRKSMRSMQHKSKTQQKY